MKRLLLPAVAALCALAPAQTDVLIVEKHRDQGARNRLAAALRKIRFTFDVAEAQPKDLCRYLASLTGDKVNFLLRDRDAMGDVEPLSLRMARTDMMTAMGAIQGATGLRFVYRDGIVWLARVDDVKPVTFLRVYDLRGATQPIPNFPGPEIGLSLGEQYFPPEPDESTTTVSGFTADRIEDLIRNHVTPEAWDADGVRMANQNGMFMVRHTPEGHRQVRELIYSLGVMPRPRVIVLPRPRPRPPARGDRGPR